jgi:hypothetical protein
MPEKFDINPCKIVVRAQDLVSMSVEQPWSAARMHSVPRKM